MTFGHIRRSRFDALRLRPTARSSSCSHPLQSAVIAVMVTAMDLDVIVKNGRIVGA